MSTNTVIGAQDLILIIQERRHNPDHKLDELYKPLNDSTTVNPDFILENLLF